MTEAAASTIGKYDGAGAGSRSSARAGLAASVVDGQVFLLGGHDGESPLKRLEGFVPRAPPEPPGGEGGVWRDLPPMLARRAYLSTVELSGRIYAIGGSADGRTLNTLEVYYPNENTWAQWFTMPPMQTKRTLHGSAVGGNRIFVAGGFDGTRDLTSVECYDPATNAWSWKSRMGIGRSYLALTAVGDSIYAIGGQDRRSESGPRAHGEVEVLDLYSERWNLVAPLNTGRLGLAAAVLIDEEGVQFVYVCGGSDGSKVLNSTEKFNVTEGTWTEAPPMNIGRLGHAAAVVDNRLYVFGGFDGNVPLDTFECYDPKTQHWSPLMKMAALPPLVRETATAAASEA